MARAGDYARAGIAATNNTLNTLRAVRDNSPKYDEIQTEGMRQRANIKIAGLQAEGEVARAAINAEAKVRVEKARIDGQNARREGKRAVAKAGVVAAAGSLIGDAFKKPGPDPMKPFQTDYSDIDALMTQQGEKIQGDIESAQTDLQQINDGTYVPPGSEKPIGYTGGSSSSGNTGGSSGSGGSVTPPPAGKKVYSQEEIQSFAINAGFTPEESKLVSRIAMGESSGNPMAFNGKGADQSYGLMQINMLGDMGPERRAEFGLTSNDQLYDPQTNMNAAYKIYKQQGWGAWGAYTNGSYLNF